MSTKTPALYIGHGAPLLLDDPIWSGQLAQWANQLEKPKGILVVSAHWESAPISLSAAGPATDLVYDFSGFDPKYYRMTYETPDATALAAGGLHVILTEYHESPRVDRQLFGRSGRQEEKVGCVIRVIRGNLVKLRVEPSKIFQSAGLKKVAVVSAIP